MTRYLTLKFATYKDLDRYLSEKFPPFWELHSVVNVPETNFGTSSPGFVVIIQQTSERAASQRMHTNMVARRAERQAKRVINAPNND